MTAVKKTVEGLLSKRQSVRVEHDGEAQVKKPKQEFDPFLQSLLMDHQNYENDDNLDSLSFEQKLERRSQGSWVELPIDPQPH